MEIRGFCTKCKMRGREIKNPIILKNNNGTFMAKGRCEACGTVCCKIMSKNQKEEYDLEE